MNDDEDEYEYVELETNKSLIIHFDNDEGTFFEFGGGIFSSPHAFNEFKNDVLELIRMVHEDGHAISKVTLNSITRTVEEEYEV